jgi:putative membrane protein
MDIRHRRAADSAVAAVRSRCNWHCRLGWLFRIPRAPYLQVMLKSRLLFAPIGTETPFSGLRGKYVLLEVMMKLLPITAFALLLLSPAHAADSVSQTFVKKAIEGNYAEIQMGQLAKQNGQSEDVKTYGQMLADDHSAANQKAMEAAKSIGVAAPDGPNAKQKSAYEKMSKLTGAKFDREFARHMIADHQKDIADYKKAAKQSNEAGEYAKAQIPVLQEHLEAAKSLSSKKTSGR